MKGLTMKPLGSISLSLYWSMNEMGITSSQRVQIHYLESQLSPPSRTQSIVKVPPQVRVLAVRLRPVGSRWRSMSRSALHLYTLSHSMERGHPRRSSPDRINLLPVAILRMNRRSIPRHGTHTRHSHPVWTGRLHAGQSFGDRDQPHSQTSRFQRYVGLEVRHSERQSTIIY